MEFFLHGGESKVEYLQSARKSERPSTNPMYDVAIARSENTSTIGCRKFVNKENKIVTLDSYVLIICCEEA